MLATMTYKEYKQKRQEEVNALPLHWAYSDKQFEELCESLQAKPEDFSGIPWFNGALILKKDWPAVREWLRKPDPLEDLMKDYDFAYQAFYEEMGNHEYHINWQGDWDVLSCFWNVEYDYNAEDMWPYFDQLKLTADQRGAYLNARADFMKACDENGWY